MNPIVQVPSPMLGGSNVQSSMTTSPGISSYPGNVSPYPTSNPGSGGGHTAMSPSQNTGHGREQRGSSGTSNSGYILSSGPPMTSTIMSSSHYAQDFLFDQPRTTTSAELVYLGLPALSIPPDSSAPDLISPWQSSSDSNYSTPDESGRGTNLIGSYGSPDWTGSALVSSYQPSTSQDLGSPTASSYIDPFSAPSQYHGQMMDMHMPFQDEHILDHAHHHQPYSPVRSISPQTIVAPAQTAENLVTASISLSGPPPLLGRFKGAALSGPLSAAAASLTAIGLSRAVRNAIPEYLELYWKRCDTHFPLVHRRSVNSSGELLRCAMAAMATQYLPGKEDRIRGNQLHEFAWQEVKRVGLRCPQLPSNPDHPAVATFSYVCYA